MLVSGVVLLALALLAVWQVGPRYGVYLVPPSPAAYADDALTKMEAGYHPTGPEWDRARAEAVRKTRDADSYAATLPALREAVAVAGGKHSTIFESGKDLGSTDTERPLPQVSNARGITTVTVPKLSAPEEGFRNDYATRIANGIDAQRTRTSCGWIVDLRSNHGGDMSPMLSGLSALLGDGKVGGFVDRNGTTTDLTLAGGTVRVGGSDQHSVGARARAAGPVAVLQGPDTGSSGEVVVLAFKGAQGARSFGAPTAGYSSANQTVRLYDGTGMLLTTAVDVDRTGARYGGAITPVQPAPVDQAAAAATTWLQGQCASS
ncbi:hypothetical protein ADJ73_00340 [Arsenicicoccus sp. oral taxon 190]|nr:hypothetical protein ADJ73_00340 [Arsenicicoccus sp. oral taxon 190]